MPAEERKLATVLFADLVGSTELAADQDPERVRAMLDRCHGCALPIPGPVPDQTATT